MTGETAVGTALSPRYLIRPPWPGAATMDENRGGPAKPGGLLVTGSIPRLLSYATVGAGVAAAGYVGLVTGRLPAGSRHRPAGPAPRPTAGRHGRPPRGRLRHHRRAVSGSATTGPGRQATGAGTRQRHGVGGPLHPARWAVRPDRPDGGDGPVHPARAGRLPAGPRAGSPRRGGLRAHRAGQWGRDAAGLRRGDRGRPVAGGAVLVCGGCAALGGDGGGLVGGGQGRGRTACDEHRGSWWLPPGPTAPSHSPIAATAAGQVHPKRG